jgi:hypothetical protein
MNGERYEKTISIPVIIQNGKIQTTEGNSLPKLSKNAYGNLIIPAIFFKDKSEQKKFASYEIIDILEKETKVLIGVNPKFIPNSLMDSLIKIPTNNSNAYLFVEVILKDNLRLKRRYNKLSKLMGCNCIIPLLDNLEAISLNHAYTLISQKYETKRISHTGNVFEICYVQQNDKWVPLDIFR